MSSLDEVSLLLGELKGQVKHLTTLAGDHTETMSRIREDVGSLKQDMKDVKADVAAFRPAAQKVAKWEQRVIGFGALSGVLGAVVLERMKGWFF